MFPNAPQVRDTLCARLGRVLDEIRCSRVFWRRRRDHLGLHERQRAPAHERGQTCRNTTHSAITGWGYHEHVTCHSPMAHKRRHDVRMCETTGTPVASARKRDTLGEENYRECALSLRANVVPAIPRLIVAGGSGLLLWRRRDDVTPGPCWAPMKISASRTSLSGQEHRYTEIYGEFGASEIEVIMPSFPLQSYGKVPEPVCKKADTWLRKAMRLSPRAVLALSYPTEQERKRQNSFGGRKG